MYVLELSVICSTACGVDQSASDTRDEQLILDGELYDTVQIFLAISQHSIQFFGLRHGSGESVQNEAEEN